MSSASQPYDPTAITKGRDRYARFAEDFIGLRLSEIQREVLETVAENQRTLIWGANGPGKSYITAALKLGFLYSNIDSIVLGTSGSYQQYEDTMWRPLKDMWDDLKDQYGLPGRDKGGNRPSIEIDNEWYAKIVSPRSPGELEGRHNADVLVVIDEADKKHVTEEHFDSAGSSITDLNDKMVAICNPPEDSNNVVAKKKESDRWKVIEISAFESHNAKIDAGLINDTPIPGLVDLITIASDWESWNKRPWPLAPENYPGEWPGMPEITRRIDNGSLDRDDALEWISPGYHVGKEAHLRWDSLDKRWYIRRAGIIPPAGAETHKPIQTRDVKDAWDRPSPQNATSHPRTIGVDVARSQDRTVMIGEHVGELRVHYAERGDNHQKQQNDIVNGTTTSVGLKDWREPDVAVDMGYAPGFHDYIADRVPNVVGFQNGTKPTEEETWYDKWAEALFHMGEWLEEGGVINDAELREELIVASRIIEFEERALNSRGPNGAEVFQATSKSDVKEELGRSPDYLDAALMAIWRLRTDPIPKSIDSTWYDPLAT